VHNLGTLYVGSDHGHCVPFLALETNSEAEMLLFFRLLNALATLNASFRNVLKRMLLGVSCANWVITLLGRNFGEVAVPQRYRVHFPCHPEVRHALVVCRSTRAYVAVESLLLLC